MKLKSGSRAKKEKNGRDQIQYTGQDGHGVDIEKKKAREYVQRAKVDYKGQDAVELE